MGRKPEGYVSNYNDGDLLFRDNGFYDGFYAGPYDGQLSTYRTGSEIFADMFLGWVLGKWGDNDRGNDRNEVMTTEMGSWITEAQAR